MQLYKLNTLPKRHALAALALTVLALVVALAMALAMAALALVALVALALWQVEFPTHSIFPPIFPPICLHLLSLSRVISLLSIFSKAYSGAGDLQAVANAGDLQAVANENLR